MSNDSQLEQLQTEWRAGVISKLDNLGAKIDSMSLLFAHQNELKIVKDELKDTKEDVIELQAFRNKSIGIILAFNALASIVAYFIAKH